MDNPQNFAAPSPETAAAAQQTKQQYEALKDAVGGVAGGVRNTAASYAEDLKDRTTDWVETRRQAVAQRSHDLQEGVEEYVERNPYRAVALAAGIGFLFGLILKRR